MDTATITVAVDYINEIRHHMDTGDIATAAVIVDLLEDIINPGAVEWQVYECDYCGDVVNNASLLTETESGEDACAHCMENADFSVNFSDDDIVDAFGYDDAEWSTVIDSTCDYCSERSANVQPVINSMFWACESCYSNSVV